MLALLAHAWAGAHGQILSEFSNSHRFQAAHLRLGMRCNVMQHLLKILKRAASCLCCVSFVFETKWSLGRLL